MSALQTPKPVIELVRHACLQLNLAPPNDVYGSNDEHAQLMGSVINLAGALIGEAFDWQHLRKTFTAIGDGVRTNYDLPADFSRVINNTGWSTAIRRPVTVLNAQQWAAVSRWLSQSFFVNPACRINQDQMQFMSPPALDDNVVFEYVSSYWVRDADDPTVFKDTCSKNADTPLFDWILMVLALKTKWREAKGLDTIATQSDFNDRYSQLTQRDEIAPTLTLSGPVVGGFRYLDNYYNTPDTGFGL